MMSRRTFYAVIAICALGLFAPRANAIVIHNESINGDLSNNPAAPSPFILAVGTNSIVGSVTNNAGADPREFVVVTVPAGFQLSHYVNPVYTSTDGQGFTGFQFGSTFAGGIAGINTSSNYRGWSHFGFASNNGFSTFDSTTVPNMFQVMIDESVPQGAQGFTIPLGAGDYTFLIQQTGTALTGYQFDFNVQPVPEPSSLILAGLGGVAVLARWRKGRKSEAQVS